MNNSGVNMNNVEFILGPTDSYWTRDYGPWWVIDGQKNMSIVDFTYNRPRPNDNDVENMNEFLGWIPPQTDIEIIEYFIKAADSSGRSERHPIAGWHSFEAMPTEACIDWILGDLDNSFDLNILDVLLMSDHIANNEVDGVCLEFVSDINNDNSITILDLIYLTNMIMNP